MESQKNDAFTSIRLFWATTVVIFHIGVIYQDYFDKDRFHYLFHGNFAVVNFFIISGFLITLHHEKEFLETKRPLKIGMLYTLKSIRKNYLVYVISFLPWMVVDFFQLIKNYSIESWGNFVLKLLLNVFLLQPICLFREDLYWNNVSWFFCVLMMIYIISPMLVKLCKQFVWLILPLSVFAIVYIGDIKGILYYSFLYRIFFFIIGICLCLIIKTIKDKLAGCNKYRVIPYAVLAIHIASWFANTVWIYSVSSCLFITTFYLFDDIRLFSRKWFLFGGEISNYIYLLHNVVLSFFSHFVVLLLPPNNLVRLWLNFVLVGVLYFWPLCVLCC